MNFQQFAEAHGLMVGSIVVGRWVRVPTRDHPRSRNGAYKLGHGVGWVQNWATMTEPAMWQGAESEIRVDAALIRRADAEQRQRREKAARRAETILSECELLPHAYLAAKGFPDARVNVWRRPDQAPVAVIPMRCAGRIVGCQLIDEGGGKKFLPGQASGGAEFVFQGRGGLDVLCEGYATALSARLALAKVAPDARLHVCFSAGNMARIAAGLSRGLVLADNDASGTGERVAREIGWPYWMSDRVGEDANDYHQRRGVFALSQGLRKVLMSMRC